MPLEPVPDAGPICFPAAEVSAQGVKNGAEKKLSSGSGDSSFTTALWNGTTFGFAWRDDRDVPAGNTEIYFAFVGCP